MQRDNSRAFPDLVRELEGIAHGAGVPVDAIWASTLISELESLLPVAPRIGHCTDMYAIHQGGTERGFAHGHNEDWPGVVKEYWWAAGTQTKIARSEPIRRTSLATDCFLLTQRCCGWQGCAARTELGTPVPTSEARGGRQVLCSVHCSGRPWRRAD